MKKFLALKADAGSGKTFALSVRFIALVLQGEKISQILAITFTNKATNEMKSRIISTFNDIANAHDKTIQEIKKIKHFAELCELCKILHEEINDEKLIKVVNLAHDKLAEFMLSELRIMTFDSFFAMILRQFSLNLGLMPDFKVAEDIQNEVLMQILNDFSDEQINEMISIMKLSDTNRDNILESFKEIVKIDISIPLSKAPNIDFATKFNEIVDLWNMSGKSSKLKMEKITRNSKKNANYVVSRVKSKTVAKFDDLNFIQKLSDLKDLLRQYYLEFEAYKISSSINLASLYQKARKQVAQNTGKMSFDDVVNLVYELLCKNKINVDWLYFKLDGDIKNILIDEFQDTSVYQYKIMFPLISEIVSGFGQNGIGSFFYVGDIKQSIYRFRDAKKELFDALTRKFSQIQIASLDTNYRSKKVIVDFVNNTFKDVIKGFVQNQKSVKDGGFVEICDFEICNDDTKFDNFLDILEQKLRFFLDNGAKINDIAILCQNNKDCEFIKDYLESKNIKVYINAKSLLINTMPVRLVIEYLRYCLFGDKAYFGALEVVLNKQFAKLNLDIKDLPSTLKYLVIKLGLDEFEPNLMKLYELSLNYKNVVDFVYNIEKSDEISANLNAQGINLMTIHKSKGLEFENVIVCDCLNSQNKDNNQFLTNYDENMDLWEVRIKDENFEYLEDMDYLYLKDKIETLKKDELINRLYVAFTRAKSALILLAKSNGDGNNKSYLRQYISNKIPTAILDLPNQKIGKFEPNLETNQNLEFEDKLKPFEQVLKQNLSDINDENNEISIENVYFGNALHFMLEMSNLGSKLNMAAFEALRNKFGAFLSHEQLENIKFRVELLTNNEKFSKIIENKNILKEQNIAFDGNLYRFDLLCMNQNEIIVIDYKTSKIQDAHKVQVDKYVQILKNLYSDKDISGFVVYLHEDGIKFSEVIN